MRILRWTVPLLAILTLALTFGAPARAGIPADSITAAEIRGHVFFLAGEEIGGRGLGSPGLRIASIYAASRLRAAGLRPAFEEGNRLSYFQPVPIVRRSIAVPPEIKARTATGERTLVHGEDFKWFTGSPPRDGARPRAVIDAGYAIHEPETEWDDLRGLDLEDKVALIRLGVPAEGFPEVLVARYKPFNSFMRKLTDLLPFKPAAVFIVLTPEMESGWAEIPTIEMNPPFAYRDPAPDAISVPFVAVLRSETAKALTPGTEIVLSAATIDEEIEARNVAGWVEGRDPALKDEVVVVSAHLDHLLSSAGGPVFPGANDNASGSAAVLEIAEAMAQDPPRRSVLFVLFTAEEGGAMGALHFLSRPPFPRGRIVADLNMDMIGRNEAGSAEERVQYALDAGVIRPAFPRLIREVNGRSVNWPLRFEHPLGLGDSDHRIFEAFRIPAVNFYTGRIPDTHAATDTPEKIDYAKAESIARLVFEIARELAERKAPWE
jgi:hypothetical protein